MTENKKETPATTEVDIKVNPCNLKIKVIKSDAIIALKTVEKIINDVDPFRVSEVEIIIQP